VFMALDMAEPRRRQLVCVALDMAEMLCSACWIFPLPLFAMNEQSAVVIATANYRTAVARRSSLTARLWRA
jgi:hypothetical protein